MVQSSVLYKIGCITTTMDYCGSVVYENAVAKSLLTEEGYVSLIDNKYHYYLKDHQGNNRAVLNESGIVEETTSYYPFGGITQSTGNVQPYKYNGKELDRENGLDWYDYGFQVYDNYRSGKSGYDAWVGDVNFVSVGLSALNPAGRFKIVKTLIVEATKETVSYPANEGVTVNNEISTIAINSFKNTVV